MNKLKTISIAIGKGDDVKAWKDAASADNRSLSNWLKQLANAEVRRVKGEKG